MKLRCTDGKIRRFRIAHVDGESYEGKYGVSGTWEAKCLECGKEFGVQDTKLLKPKFRSHICNEAKT